MLYRQSLLQVALLREYPAAGSNVAFLCLRGSTECCTGKTCASRLAAGLPAATAWMKGGLAARHSQNKSNKRCCASLSCACSKLYSVRALDLSPACIY